MTSSDQGHGFFWWGTATYLAATAYLLVAALRVTDGRVVYPLDDPAIHLALARTIAEHGTWGIEAGHFQSASSSPVWTLLLAGVAFVVPSALTVTPWVVNVAASLWVIAALGADQRALLPGRRRLLDGPVVAVLVAVVLLLPAVSVLGMEHTLHMALVLSALVLFRRLVGGVALGWPRWTPYALLALATLVRLESAFLAAGLVLGMVSQPLWDGRAGQNRRLLPDRRQFGRAALTATSSLVPLLAFAAFNRAMGQGWLPNSVLAKSPATSGHDATARFDVLDRFTRDPLLGVLTVVVIVLVVVGWRRRAWVFVAIAVAVTSLLQIALADVGWYDRYQAYVIVLCVYVLLRVATEVAPADGVHATALRNGVLVGLTVVVLVVGVQKIRLTADVDLAVADTYEQRYQAGRFLERHYDGRPVATGELGYIAWHHGGPITDVWGLGDHEVLEFRRSHGQHPGPDYWSALAEERGFDVVVVYPTTLWPSVPQEWILVGEWDLGRRIVTAYDPVLQFWATRPEGVAPLREALLEFEPELPGGSTLHLDDLAQYRADELLDGG